MVVVAAVESRCAVTRPLSCWTVTPAALAAAASEASEVITLDTAEALA